MAKPNNPNVIREMLGFTRVVVILGFLMSLKVYFLHSLLSKARSTQPTNLRQVHANIGAIWDRAYINLVVCVLASTI